MEIMNTVAAENGKTAQSADNPNTGLQAHH